MPPARKILIVKLGHSETLLPHVRRVCSLGDVFRTTALLHVFKDDKVTWLTDEAAVPLLEDNPLIDRILAPDPLTVAQLEAEHFDIVINLEKVPSVCALVGRIEAKTLYGFRFDPESSGAVACEKAHDALAIATNEDIKKLNNRSWVEVLHSIVGEEWHGDSFVLGYRPRSEVQYDLGFNVQVGSLMPEKAWPMENWHRLETLTSGRYTWTYQQHPDDLKDYMDWINTCRLLITNDSLGLYLGIALGKKVLALFGPTSPREQSPHENLRILTADADRDHSCLAPYDPTGRTMDEIEPERIFAAITAWMAEG